jgi:hypothetical protein
MLPQSFTLVKTLAGNQGIGLSLGAAAGIAFGFTMSDQVNGCHRFHLNYCFMEKFINCQGGVSRYYSGINLQKCQVFIATARKNVQTAQKDEKVDY